jgi:hypothetical protein
MGYFKGLGSTSVQAVMGDLREHERRNLEELRSILCHYNDTDFRGAVFWGMLCGPALEKWPLPCLLLK